MNRTMKLAILTVAAAGAFASVGCMGTRPGLQNRYAGAVDPSWPERYNYQARQEVVAPFAAHVTNGAVVDQTLANYHFEQGTDKLNPAGLEKLDYLVRRRPAPDTRVYLATARDLAFDPAAPEKRTTGVSDLDAKRAAAVHKYLAATTASRNLAFEVQVIDLPDFSQKADGPATAVRGYPTRFQSGLAGGAGTLNGAGGGAAPTASSGAPAGGSR